MNLVSRVLFTIPGLTALAACTACSLEAAQLLPPPDPKPLFRSEGFQRKPLQLKVREFTKHGHTVVQPSLFMGNKAICILCNNGNNYDWGAGSRIFLVANQRTRLGISFSSHGKAGHPWFNWMSEAELKKHGLEQLSFSADVTTGAITCKAPYAMKEGEAGYLTYTLKPLDAGRAELSWDAGADIPLNLNFGSTNAYRGKTILFGKEKFVEAPLEKIKARKAGSREFASDTLELEPDNLELNFGISGLGTNPIRVSEGVQPLTGDNFHPVFIANTPVGRTGKVIIDVGQSEFYSGANIPLVNGFDFYKNNGFHVPLPATRNELPNPSFEQDLHYWQWTPGWGECPVRDTYTFSSDALFGKKALLIRNHNEETLTLASLPMALLPDEDFTASFYVKSANSKPATASLWIGGNRYGDGHGKGFTVGCIKLKGDEGWTRYSRTFKRKSGPFQLLINARPGSEVLIDGMQLERGPEATEFVCDPVEGNLVTSAAPDNDVEFGKPVNARLDFVGSPGTKASVEVKIKNFFRETVHQETLETTIGKDGTSSAKLDSRVDHLGKGVFIVGATYHVDGSEPYTKYNRYSVMTFLDNTHPTHMLTGTLCQSYLKYGPRVYDYGRKLKEWGYGSASWGRFQPKDKKSLYLDTMEKNGIKNVHMALQEQVTRGLKDEEFPRHKDDLALMRKYKKHVARFADIPLLPAEETYLEEACYEFCKTMDPASALSVSWSNEEQNYPLMANKQFDEYFKYQHAAVKGAKRAMPNIQTTFSSGVCNILHHLGVVDGWLAAAHKAGFKYDALTAHAYGGFDGGGALGSYDLDVQLRKFFDIAAKYGYGKETPFYMTEINNDRVLWIPEWNTQNGDTYRKGLPTYDWGQWEYIHAASTLRQWLIALKYWPQFVSTNIWQSTPMMDYHMTPYFFTKAANTVGNMLPWVECQGDIKPTPGVRGYAYRLKDGTGIAAIWFINKKLELGMLDNARFQVQFTQPVRFFDMMENERSVRIDEEGSCAFPLTPAPLFIKAKNVKALLADLNKGKATFEEETREVSVKFGVDKAGDIHAVVKNCVSRPQEGELTIEGKAYPYSLEPSGEQTIALPGLGQGDDYGRMYDREIAYFIKSKSKTVRGSWTMSYLFVPEAKGMPRNWAKIPAYPLSNIDKRDSRRHRKHPGDDFSAQYRLAWDKDNLYVRVEVVDATFLYDPKLWKNPNCREQLWGLDGCLELYFDCEGDGRAAELKGIYELDDCRFDFAMNPKGESGPGIVNRWRSVDVNIGGGVGIYPTKELFRKLVANNWERTKDGYTYTIALPQRCILPLTLEKGWCAGFASYVHSHDKPDWQDHRAIHSGLEPDKHPQAKPATWPLMILK